MPLWSDGVSREETYEGEPEFNKFLREHSKWRFENDLMALKWENHRLKEQLKKMEKTKAAGAE